MRKLVVKISYVIWALKRINDPALGDIVVYKNQDCALIQGVANPYWDLLPLNDENMNKPKRDIYYRVHRSEFKLDKSINRYIWAFKMRYKFKMDNWFMIDTWNKSIFSPICKI